MTFQLNGTENLMICLEVLQDLQSQLLGDPAGAIAAIKRSGALVSSPAWPQKGKSFDQREAIAQAKIVLVRKRKKQKEAVSGAIAVIQESLRDIGKSRPLAERLSA